MTKRFLSILLVLSLLSATFVIAVPIAHAATVLESGKAGDNITWTTYDDGRLVFSGTGRMDDGKYWLVKDWSHHDPVDVIFEEGITYIGAYSFYSDWGFKSIRTVTFPGTLTEIGEYAFEGLIKLEKVYITNLKNWCSVTYGNGAHPMDTGADLYLKGEKVVDLVIPNNITKLCNGAFWGCESLRSVYIPDHVTEIGNNAFSYCSNLEKIYFKGEPPIFGSYVFYGCHALAYCPVNSGWNESVFSQNTEGVTWLWDQQKPFADVPTDSWFCDSVSWALGEGITKGVSETSFAPNSSCTRAQIITFLWRAAGRPESMAPVSSFTDVKEGDYFYKPVLWAEERGITRGVTEATFGPDEPCTRAQIVTFLHRAAQTPEPKTEDHPFVDVSPDAYYYRAVLWAVEMGITNGMTATTFEPDDRCTRAQTVCFLHRYSKTVK